MIQLITNYGITVIITALFIWDWVTNRKIVSDSIKEIATANTNIERCLESLFQNSENTSKPLELIHQILETQDKKIDKLLERRQ